LNQVSIVAGYDGHNTGNKKHCQYQGE
jgi:hypothetical protein